jgi:acetyltransferase
MNLRTDGEQGALSEELRTGLPMLRHRGLPLAAACPLGHETFVDDAGRTLVLRPIRPDDARAYEEMLSAGDSAGVNFRFPGIRRPVTRAALTRLTQIDHEGEMAFVAASEDELLGEVRIRVFPGSDAAEFAIFVHPQARRQGIARALLSKMIRYCSARGLSEIIGQIAAENERMLGLARSAGMDVHRAPGAGLAVAHLKLSGSAPVANSSPTLAASATKSATARQ